MTLVDVSQNRERMLLYQEYWTQTLREPPPDLSLPWARRRIAEDLMRGTIEKTIEPRLLASLSAKCSGSTLLTTIFVMASAVCVLDRFTAAGRVVFGAADIDDRFADAVVFVRLAVDHGRSFKEMFAEARARVQQGHAFAALDLDTVLESNGCSATHRKQLHQLGVCSFKSGPARRASFDVCVLIDMMTGRLGFEFWAGEYSPDSMVRLLRHVVVFLEAVVASPYSVVSDIDILANEDRLEVLDAFNSNIATIPPRSLPHLIEEQALQRPGAIAIVHEAREVTYAALNAASNRIAARLRRSVAPGSVVAVFMHRSPELVSTILGVWKSGCAYLPIDPEAPAAWNQGVFDSARPAIVVCEHSRDQVMMLARGAEVFDLRADAAQFERETSDNVTLDVGHDALAYVIYTSGSTGRPKGAMIEHGGMLNHICAKIVDLAIDARSVVAQNASHCFDISIWQSFAPLCSGGMTVIYSRDTVLDVDRFLDLVARHVSVLELVPSYFSLVLDALERRPRKFSVLGRLVLNAETLPPSMVERWFRLYPRVPVLNTYGITEVSDDVAHHTMFAPCPANNVPVGRTLQNMCVYVVDEKMRPCPVGVKGEICIAGIAVGRGYLNDPERTAASFTEDPFRPERGRMYRSGDIGRWAEDGTLEFFGRWDQQVKVRGYRVDLAEVERTILEHPAIKQGAVVHLPEHVGHKLYCHFVSKRPISPDALRAFVADRLPEYMVPLRYLEWQQLPLNANGKIDRGVLRARASVAAVETGGPGKTRRVEPRSDVEQRLRDHWVEALRNPNIGIADNFFESGGDSMTAIRVAAEYGHELRAIDIFNFQTIEALAKHLEERLPERKLLQLLTPPGVEPLMTVVAMPHSAGDPVTFREAANALALGRSRCRLYGVSLPRTVLTEADTALSMMTRLADGIVEEIMQCVSGRLFVYGQCSGSGVALAVAERLQAANVDVVGVGLGGVLPRTRVEHEQEPFRQARSGAEILAFLRRIGGTIPDNPEDAAFFLRDFRYDTGIANGYFNDCLRRIQSGRFSKLRGPLYLFMGDSDPMVANYRIRSREWYRYATSIRIVEFEKLGHYLLRDRPEAFASVLNELAQGGIAGAPLRPRRLLDVLLRRGLG